MISKNLRNLAREWNHAKRSPKPRIRLAFKNLRLLEFPYDDNFFETATDAEYHDKIKTQLLSKSKDLPEAHALYIGMDALKHKAGIVATMRRLKMLAIDLSDKEEFFKHFLFTIISQRKTEDWNEVSRVSLLSLRYAADLNQAQSILPPAAVTPERALGSHFSQLQLLELRCARSLFLSKDGIAPGTMVIQGSWPLLPSLKTFKYHGHIMSKDIQSTFLGACVPRTVALNGFACNGRHHVFNLALDITREEFQNSVATFSWKNMEPCGAVIQHVPELLQTQTESLKTVSLVRRRLLVDVLRSHEKFSCGELTFRHLAVLEYLDIDSRFLIKTEQPKFEALLEWLGLPTSLQTLSIDAITDREVPYFEVYLEHLFDAVKGGILPDLKNVRCGFMGMKHGKKVQGWKVLGNMPGKFLCYGVWVTGWHYDDEEEDEGDTIAARVRARAGRRRRRPAA
jgi:hypothetical protein